MSARALLAQASGVEPIDMPHVDWGAVAPLALLFVGALVLLTVSALLPGPAPKRAYAISTVVVALATAVSGAILWDRVGPDGDGPFTAVAGALSVDRFSAFFVVLISAGIVLAALLCDDYLRRERLDGPEVYVLMLLSASGGVLMAMANDLIVVFLGLEILSIALYVLTGSHLRRAESQEGAIKYFVLGAFSSAFLLYGIALVYGATGSTNLTRISEFLSGNILAEDGLLLAGFAMLLVGFGFKVAAVPFHVWTPDVYQGAPTPVTAFMASVSKAAGFAGLLRVFSVTFEPYRDDWRPVVYVLAILTMLLGSFLAIVQTDVKRMLAYSSINHAGFILVGVEAATDRGTSAALFYLLAYTFMVVGSFGVVTLVGRRGDAHHSLDDYRGLSAARPALALAFAVFLLAQAGVPFTSGFMAKFYVIGAAIDAESYSLAIVAMVSAVVSAYLYLRIVVAMYMTAEPDEVTTARRRIAVPAGAQVSLALALAFTVVVGILPSGVIDFARDAVPIITSAGP